MDSLADGPCSVGDESNIHMLKNFLEEFAEAWPFLCGAYQIEGLHHEKMGEPVLLVK